MSKKETRKPAPPSTLEETAKALEEKIFDAKDATLRLWERNRQMQQKVGSVEQRLRLLMWVAGGLLLVILGLGAVIAKSQLSPFQHQVAALQETIGPLQTKLEDLAKTVETRATTATSEPNDARSKQIEQEVNEAVRKLAPTILASAAQENNQGTTAASSIPLVSSALGAATGPKGVAMRLVVGSMDPKQTPWKRYNQGGIYVDIDTSRAGFTATPYYFTSLSGHTNNWLAQGVTSIYLPTATGFRVHVGHRELTAEQANNWGWSISWIAIGK
jgi:hypothetical protein